MTDPGGAHLRDHPDLAALHWRTSADLRDERAAEERDAQQSRWQERSLTDFAHESMNRGDEVTVAAGGVEYAGVLVAATDRLLTIESPSATVHFNPDRVDWLRVGRRGRGHAGAGSTDLRSFEAVLRMYETTGESVRLIARDGRLEVVGPILAVSRDHVYLRSNDAAEVVVSQDALACVIQVSTLGW